jgi:hypothetical protein
MTEPRPSECCPQIVAERDQAIVKLDQAIAECDRLRNYLQEMCAALRVTFDFEATARARDEAIAERDEAIAERDFVLDFLQELGEAFGTSQRLGYRPAARGAVWIHALYPSPAAAADVTLLITRLRAMVGMTQAPWRVRAFETFQARVAAQQRI